MVDRSLLEKLTLLQKIKLVYLRKNTRFNDDILCEVIRMYPDLSQEKIKELLVSGKYRVRKTRGIE